MASQAPNEGWALPATVIARAEALMARGGRQILGIAGTPGAGKSTVAAGLAAHFGPPLATVVPMDGYHLANVELARLGRHQRKGAPDTFDALGYHSLLKRLKTPSADETVYAPAFDRQLEEPIAGAIPVEPQVQLIISEGNYLLLDQAPWAGTAALFDEVWFVDVDSSERYRRLVTRHVYFGRTAEEADNWVRTTDEPNARLIDGSRQRADFIFSW